MHYISIIENKFLAISGNPLFFYFFIAPETNIFMSECWLASHDPVVRKQMCVIDMHFLEYLSNTIDKQTVAQMILS